MSDALQRQRHAEGSRDSELPPTRTQTTFSLSSLFRLVTWIAVCLALGSAVPVLVAALAFVSIPALLRATDAAAHYTGRGGNLSIGRKIGLFLRSLGIVFMVVIAAIATFVLLLWVAGPMTAPAGGAFVGVGVLALVLPALFVGGWLFMKSWPRQ